MALIPLELVCFGPPTARLVGSDTPPELRWQKHVALLIYLALSPRQRRTRDHLLGLLWAEQPEQGARKALNTAVNRLRIALGSERLRSESGALALSDSGLDVDALRLVAQAESAPEAALPLLRGDFLEGFHIKDAPEFEDWMMRERERYRALAAATLVAAGERRLSGELSTAADLARRALGLESTNEGAVRVLMQAAALAGDGATALAAYHAFAEQLKRATGEQPTRGVAALAERIRNQRWRPPGSETTLSAPLVGRERLHQQVFDAVGKGSGIRAVVISGPPGMGRSRLLAECAQRLALNGARLLQIRPVQSDHDARWSALRQIVRAGLGELPGAAAARPEALAAVAALAPDLAKRFAPREVPDVADMADALASVLAAVAEEQPLALVIDDAHWADGSSLAGLGAALRQLSNSPVTLLMSVAHGVGDPPTELLQLQSEIGRAIRGIAARLGPLEPSEVAKLVVTLAPWCRSEAERDRLTRRLVYETGGNPFFAVTLLGALAKPGNLQKDMVAWPPPGGTIDAPLPFSVPAVARHAIGLRIRELSATDIRILSAAAVCGDALEPDLIARVAQVSRDAVERTLPACERRHLVQFDGWRYVFAAPLIAVVIRAECTMPGERRSLEQRAADALADRTDLQSRALRVDLLSRTAPDQHALELAMAVARDAEEQGARRMVERALAAAARIRGAL